MKTQAPKRTIHYTGTLNLSDPKIINFAEAFAQLADGNKRKAKKVLKSRKTAAAPGPC